MIRQVTESSVLMSMFGTDDAVNDIRMAVKSDDDYGQNMCHGRTHLMNPHWRRNIKGEMMYIVNQPEGRTDLTQLVRVTTCHSEGEKCHQGVIRSYRCKQEYSNHKLVAVKADNSVVTIETFR